jgi:predicted DNA-binding transcriptional regulator YafY
MNIKVLISLTELIEQRQTGSPTELAKKLGISERMVYKYIDDLKVEFNAPVKYSRSERTYYYDGEGHLHLFWEKEE